MIHIPNQIHNRGNENGDDAGGMGWPGGTIARSGLVSVVSGVAARGPFGVVTGWRLERERMSGWEPAGEETGAVRHWASDDLYRLEWDD